MSSYLVTAHGGGKNVMSSSGRIPLEGLIRNTKAGMKPVPKQHMEGLIASTLGFVPPPPSGMITETIPSGLKKAPGMLHKIPVAERMETVSKMNVGVPYSGSKSGYGGSRRK